MDHSPYQLESKKKQTSGAITVPLVLNRLWLLFDHLFVYLKYDLAAKKCPHEGGSIPYLLNVGARASILFF